MLKFKYKGPIPTIKKACKKCLDWKSKRWDHALLPFLHVKKAKLEKEFRESIKKGDKVITIGGIHGRILEIGDTNMLIEVDNNVKLRVERSAISVEATKIINAPKKEEKK